MTLVTPPLRAVAFDLDGTLTDSATGICSTVAAVLAEAGHPEPLDADVRAMIGLPLADIFLRHVPGIAVEDVGLLMTRYRTIYEATVIPKTLLFPRAWSLLRACRAAGLDLALVTAKSTDVAEAVLARCRVRKLFKSVVGGDRATRPKPNPDLLEVAIGELGVEPAEMLVVGDGAHDVEMGRRAGTRTCGVAWGVHAAEQLHEAGADVVVHSVRELSDVILSSTVGDPRQENAKGGIAGPAARG
jgi:phosphoglycolate phosphatase